MHKLFEQKKNFFSSKKKINFTDVVRKQDFYEMIMAKKSLYHPQSSMNLSVPRLGRLD